MRSRWSTAASRSRSSRPCVAAVAGAVDRELPEAIQILDGLVRRYPLIAAAWHQLGDFAATAGRMDRAVDAYRRAAALRPGAPADHLAAARALLRLRRLDEARQQAERGASGGRRATVNRKRRRTNCSPGLRWSGAIRPRRESRPGSLARPTRRCRRPPSSKGGSSTMPASWTGRSGRLRRPSLTSRSLVRGADGRSALLRGRCADPARTAGRSRVSPPAGAARVSAQHSCARGAGRALQRDGAPGRSGRSPGGDDSRLADAGGL